IIGQLGIGFSREGARRNAVARDSLSAVLDGQRAHHSGQALFGDGIDGVVGAREFASYGRERYEASMQSFFDHGRRGELREMNSGEQVDMDEFEDVVQCGVSEGLADAYADIV